MFFALDYRKGFRYYSVHFSYGLFENENVLGASMASAEAESLKKGARCVTSKMKHICYNLDHYRIIYVC